MREYPLRAVTFHRHPDRSRLAHADAVPVSSALEVDLLHSSSAPGDLHLEEGGPEDRPLR